MTTEKRAPSASGWLWRCAGWLLLLAFCSVLFHHAIHHFAKSAYPLKYTAIVQEASDEYGIPPSLIYAVIHTESQFDPDALSPADAKGLMQLTDETYRWALQRADRADEYASEALFDPAVNIRYGTYVLVLLQEQFSDWATLLAAYNAGQGHVKEWLADPACSKDGVTLASIPFPETETYIKRVLTAREYYQSLYDLA